MAAKTTVATLVVVWLAASTVGRSWDAHEVENKASNAVHDAKDSAEDWGHWAANKFSQGLGLSSDKAKEAGNEIVERAKYATLKSTEALNSAAYESSKYASEKASDMAVRTSQKLGDGMNYASEKANEARNAAAFESTGRSMDMASNMGNSVKDKARAASYDAYGFASDKAWQMMDDGMGTANNAYDYASTKANYVGKSVLDIGDATRKRMSDEAYGAYVFVPDEVDEVMNRASDMSSNAKEQPSDAAYNARDSARINEAMDKAARLIVGGKKVAKQKAVDMYDATSNKRDDIIRMAIDRESDEKEAMANAISRGKYKAFDTYEDVKSKAKDSMRSATANDRV